MPEKKNVNLAVLFIKLVPATAVGPMAGSPCQQSLPDLFVFTVVIKTNLDTQVSQVYKLSGYFFCY